MTKHIDIVFDGFPGPKGPRFIEVENDKGESICVGEWMQRDDHYVVLRIPHIGDEWRPIETASLDPTAKPILAWIPFRHGGGCVNIIEWDFDDSAWREWQGHLLGAYKPSHWQPLPSPPAQTGGE